MPPELGKWLVDNNLLCKRNDHPFNVQTFHYLNSSFIQINKLDLDDLVRLGKISTPNMGAIELDCEINQFIEDHYDKIGLNENTRALIRRFSLIFNGLSEAEVLEAFDFLRYMKRVHDGADSFFTKKKKMVEEYFTNNIVEIVSGGKHLKLTDCTLLTGNGFNYAVTSVGSEYSNTAILSRLGRLKDRQLPYSGRTAFRDFRSVARAVNQIMRNQDLNLVKSKIKDGRFVVIDGMFETFEPSSDLREFFLAHQVLLNAYKYQITSMKMKNSRGRRFIKRLCNISARKLSFDELLYLFSEACRTKVKQQLRARLVSGLSNQQLFDYINNNKKCESKIEIYEKLLALSLFNDGKALDKKAVLNKKRIRPGISVIQCFTTNYDSFCDFYFSCRVIHLHGSFFTFRDQNGIITQCKPGDRAAVLREVKRNNGFSLLVNIKDKLRTPLAYLPEYELLGKVKGSLVIFGFSGEYDDEIAKRIAFNSDIDRIIICYHKLDDAILKRGEKEIKREAMYYFSKMAKKIVIVDSETIIKKKLTSQGMDEDKANDFTIVPQSQLY